MMLLLWLKNYRNSYFRNLDTTKIMNNRNSGEPVVPLFTKKPSKSKNIIINGGDKTFLIKKPLKYLKSFLLMFCPT